MQRSVQSQNGLPPNSEQKTLRVTKSLLAQELKAVMGMLIGGIAVITTTGAAGGYLYEYGHSRRVPESPGHFVAIPQGDTETDGSIHIHYQLRGPENSDTIVVLDGDCGSTSFDWDKVMNELEGFVRVIAIDRPGLAYSEASEKPRTAMQIAGEYRDILEKLNLPRKVVLVGHGAGGYSMRDLARLLEHDNFKISGLVLADALEEDLRADLEKQSQAVQNLLDNIVKNGERVLTLSKFGILRLIHTLQTKQNAEKYSENAFPYINSYAPSPKHREGTWKEQQALQETERNFRDSCYNSTLSSNSYPCVVLTHESDDLFKPWKADQNITDQTIQDLESCWASAQKRLADRYSVSMRFMVLDCGHRILYEKPECIAQVVRAMLSNEATDVCDSIAAVSGLKQLHT